MADAGLIAIPFTKMTGAGNDFVLVDNRLAKLEINWSRFARIACERRRGIGADGLLVVDSSSRADFGLRYFNADGSSGGMCGNGGRCAAAFVMSERESSEVRFDALGHVYTAIRRNHDVTLEMKSPKLLHARCEVEYAGQQLAGISIDTGAPHAVFFVDELPATIRDRFHDDGIEEVGRFVRSHSTFAPDGTNVDFVDLQADGVLSMRTYERGVEGETLACGTGAVAVAVAAARSRGVAPPTRIRTRGGELLTVSFSIDEQGELRQVELKGPVSTVFAGVFKMPTQ